MPPLPLARLLSVTLRLAVDAMHEQLRAEGFDDLRPVHGYVLNAAAQGDATASGLAGTLGITKQAVAKVVTELTALGYVARAVGDDDARRRPIVLTRRGRAALDASVRIQNAIEAEWREVLGPRALAALRASLERLTDRAIADGRPVSLRPTW